MACFLVPTAEAIVTTVVMKASKEETSESKSTVGGVKVSWHQKLKWLNYLLFGGAALLAFEHLWHGEVVPWFPFLTAANNPADTAVMLHEMATVGVAMALLITAVWGVMCAVVDYMARQENKARKAGAQA